MTAAAAIPDFQPRRAKARLRTGIPASLVTLDGRQPISLVDLSESGARVEIHSPAAIGSGILKWLNFEAFGSVVWRDDQTAGLQFDNPIGAEWVLDTKECLTSAPREKEELRRFASAWVRGDGVRMPSRRPSAVAGGAAPFSDDAGARSIVLAWIRASRPFLLGGILLGAIAGYFSSYF